MTATQGISITADPHDGRGPDAARYGRVAIVLHWTIAVLILLNLPLGLLHDAIEHVFDYSAMWIHKSIGMTVLLLSLFRLAWRLGHRPPPLPLTLDRWEAAAARIVHWTFYVLMIALPVTGLIRSSAGDYPLEYFGLFDISKLPVGEGSTLARGAALGHDIMGLAMTALALAHVAAALRHHFVLRDRVLARILP